jgi:hypothetical protein
MEPDRIGRKNSAPLQFRRGPGSDQKRRVAEGNRRTHRASGEGELGGKKRRPAESGCRRDVARRGRPRSDGEPRIRCGRVPEGRWAFLALTVTAVGLRDCGLRRSVGEAAARTRVGNETCSEKEKRKSAEAFGLCCHRSLYFELAGSFPFSNLKTNPPFQAFHDADTSISNRERRGEGDTGSSRRRAGFGPLSLHGPEQIECEQKEGQDDRNSHVRPDLIEEGAKCRWVLK